MTTSVNCLPFTVKFPPARNCPARPELHREARGCPVRRPSEYPPRTIQHSTTWRREARGEEGGGRRRFQHVTHGLVLSATGNPIWAPTRRGGDGRVIDARSPARWSGVSSAHCEAPLPRLFSVWSVCRCRGFPALLRVGFLESNRPGGISDWIEMSDLRLPPVGVVVGMDANPGVGYRERASQSTRSSTLAPDRLSTAFSHPSIQAPHDPEQTHCRQVWYKWIVLISTL